ncbi:hypothetical protein GOPIP_093_00160 [Gordonia polyisoprenivorans NBRC 16320 = JCM 10675]|uniref:Uncharacterized protein n=1 Tax=Gordonia polyisoprenivorans TaxID=84595 RepID=A0A846WTT9_9ACTN|nr:hypothetical protein [Gordonia polyisoprenivorans]MBE7192047.1 hypothetical protein [Gordonia polyisoprenivorans]NKY05138.1 hypothetical protein [Gordonia polyisoprenivorans]OZC30634.1 hypothetical protein CJJ17_03520 [Gordonia polyisoprenivorans]UZF53874.1 hypothetical protein LH935_13915 [Gordonia polyisoprenivorans]GAB26211.1 hypothetical protein GOPIP_093_00160 [Gordonia polyisoprenivorans NBRC 16320 = JCM 10675]
MSGEHAPTGTWVGSFPVYADGGVFLRGDFDFDEMLEPQPTTSFDYKILTIGVETAWVALRRDVAHLGLRIELLTGAPPPIQPKHPLVAVHPLAPDETTRVYTAEAVLTFTTPPRLWRGGVSEAGPGDHPVFGTLDIPPGTYHFRASLWHQNWVLDEDQDNGPPDLYSVQLALQLWS